MLLKKIHRQVGLVLSLFVLLISVTGVLLVWKKEYLWLSFSDARQTVDQSLLADAVEEIQAQYAPDQVIFIQVHSEGLALHKVFLSGKEYAWHNQHGTQLQRWAGNERWEDWFLDLHHRFLLGNTIGLNLAGFSGLILVPLLCIGLIVWWPRRRTFKRSLLPSSFARGALLRSHGNIGVVATLPIFFVALTGVILVYPAEARWLLLSEGVVDEKIKPEIISAGDGDLSWARFIEVSQNRFPESTIKSVSPSTSKYPTRSLGLQQKDALYPGGYTRISVVAQSSVEVQDVKQQPLAQHALNFSYPFHTAKLGLLFRIFISLVGLALSLMSFFGLYSYVLNIRR